MGVVLKSFFTIEKAIESCKQSGNDPKHHFTGAGKPIPGGKESSISKIGGTPPENIPPAEHIKKVEKRLKTSKPKLLLDDKNSGLLPQTLPNSLDLSL